MDGNAALLLHWLIPVSAGFICKIDGSIVMATDNLFVPHTSQACVSCVHRLQTSSQTKAGCNLECFIVNMTISKPHHGLRPRRMYNNILYSIESTWVPSEACSSRLLPPRIDILVPRWNILEAGAATGEQYPRVLWLYRDRGGTVLPPPDHPRTAENWIEWVDTGDEFHGLTKRRAENKQIASLKNGHAILRIYFVGGGGG